SALLRAIDPAGWRSGTPSRREKYLRCTHNAGGSSAMRAAALGRGTRKGEKFPDKSHFTLFDSFDGTLFEYFRRATGITTEPPVQPSRTTAEIIEDIWRGRDREYNTRVLVKRLQGIAKEISGEARDAFAGGGISDGD